MTHKFYLIATSFFLTSLMVSSATANWMDDYTTECEQGDIPGIIGVNDIDDLIGCYKQLGDTNICYVITYIRENVAHMYYNNEGMMSPGISSQRGVTYEDQCNPYFTCTPRYAAGSEKESKWEKLEPFGSVLEWYNNEEGVKSGWLISPVPNNHPTINEETCTLYK